MITKQKVVTVGGRHLLQQTIRVVCISDITDLYGSSERIKGLEIGKTYTVTDIWEQNTEPSQFYHINGEYYPNEMFRMLDDVRNDKLNEILS